MVMGQSEGLQQVGGGAFAWHHGGWCRGGACVQQVGVVGLACCVEVARFSHGGLGSWWGLHTVAGLMCSGLAPWWDLHTTLGWCHGEVFMGWVGVEVGLAHHVGMASKQCYSKSCTL